MSFSWPAFAPLPVILSKPDNMGAGMPSKCFTTASANGCSDCFSMLIKTLLAVSSLFSHLKPVTSGRPSVMVPVLSKTIASTFFASSRLSASLIRMPFSAPLPTPTIIAVGVAKPKAQGQAITNTVTAASNPCTTPLSPPKTNHNINVRMAIPITTGTNMPAILSTNFCTGALLPCASCTVLIIWASIVSFPTLTALN